MRRGTLAFAALSAGVVLGGVSVGIAAIPDSNTGVISACAGKVSGTTRIIDYQAGKRCRSNETLITWNQKGQTGATGAQGATGPQGLVGPPGAPGAKGPRQRIIEEWSKLPRTGTERLTLFDDGILTIYGDCTNQPSSSTPIAQIYLKGVAWTAGAPGTNYFYMGYAIESTSSAMYKTVHMDALNENEVSPWGAFTKSIEGTVITGQSGDGGYPLYIAVYVDGSGNCNFRGWVIPA